MNPARCRPVVRPSQFFGSFVVLGPVLFVPSDVADDLVETSIIRRAQKCRRPSFQRIHHGYAGTTVDRGESPATKTAAIWRDPHQAQEPSHPRSAHGTFLHQATVRTSNRHGPSQCRGLGYRTRGVGNRRLPHGCRLTFGGSIGRSQILVVSLELARSFKRLVHSTHLEFPNNASGDLGNPEEQSLMLKRRPCGEARDLATVPEVVGS
jgi:hypothetical protein